MKNENRHISLLQAGERQPYLAPLAEALCPIPQQPILNGSPQLGEGSDDDEWGNDLY